MLCGKVGLFTGKTEIIHEIAFPINDRDGDTGVSVVHITGADGRGNHDKVQASCRASVVCVGRRTQYLHVVTSPDEPVYERTGTRIRNNREGAGIALDE